MIKEIEIDPDLYFIIINHPKQKYYEFVFRGKTMDFSLTEKELRKVIEIIDQERTNENKIQEKT